MATRRETLRLHRIDQCPGRSRKKGDFAKRTCRCAKRADHRVATSYRLTYRVSVAYIADNDSGADQAGRFLRRANQRGNIIATGDGLANDLAPGRAGGAEDEDFLEGLVG